MLSLCLYQIEPLGLRRFPINGKAQIFLIDDAKVRQKTTRSKLFRLLFAYTAPFLDVYQQNPNILDLHQTKRKKAYSVGIINSFMYLCTQFII